jgi:hypothetical protein
MSSYITTEQRISHDSRAWQSMAKHGKAWSVMQPNEISHHFLHLVVWQCDLQNKSINQSIDPSTK